LTLAKRPRYTRSVRRTAIALLAIAAAAGPARGDGEGPSAVAPHVPDASLRAVRERVVRLELEDAPAVEGRLLDFEDTSVTIAVSGTNEVISVPRERLRRVVAVASITTAKVATEHPAEHAAAPEKTRIVALQFGVPGTLQVDADYKLFHAFASTNVLASILTASGDSLWTASAFGAGVSLPMTSTSRWRLDVFGQVLPLHVTSFYTYLAVGAGVGFHHTAPSGFTVGFTFPVLGFATRLGSSPYGYDGPFRYNDSVGYYYFAGLVGMPLVTMGYRFATRCPN
jgi:hypothetical protein